VTKALNRNRLSVEDDIVITTAVKEAAAIAFSGTEAAEHSLLMFILFFVLRWG
jgi:hypothetical protein